MGTGRPREPRSYGERRRPPTGVRPAPVRRIAPVADPTDERAKVEWVIRAPAGSSVRITARHERAGTVRREVMLP